MALETAFSAALSGFRYSAHHICVTVPAIIQSHISVHLMNPERFLKITRCKSHTVIPSVNRFHRVFPCRIMRCMTVIAACCSVMAGTVPGVKMLPHNMAVFTRLRIIGKIGKSPGIDKCIERQPGKNSNHARCQQPQPEGRMVVGVLFLPEFSFGTVLFPGYVRVLFPVKQPLLSFKFSDIRHLL